MLHVWHGTFCLFVCMFACVCVCVCSVTNRPNGDVSTDDLLAQKEKNKLLQEEMDTTLQDIQNM